MENSIGSKTTSNNKKVKISNPQIKIAKQQRKIHRHPMETSTKHETPIDNETH